MKAVKTLLSVLVVCGSGSAFADSRQAVDDSVIVGLNEQVRAVTMVVSDGAVFSNSESGSVGIYSRTLGDMYGLCSDQKFAASQAVYGACTAFLINENQIITSPECIKGPAACETKKIIFGFARDSENLSDISPDDYYSCKSVDGNLVNNVGGAYRVVTLDRPVKHIAPLQIDTTPIEVGDDVYMLSHSHGLALRVSASTVFESTPRWNRFRAGLSASRGSEGAPIFSRTSGKVVGVHTSNLNNGVRNNPFRGCNELKICEGEDCFLEILGTANLFQRFGQN